MLLVGRCAEISGNLYTFKSTSPTKGIQMLNYEEKTVEKIN
jgi:hypothetical protein